MMKSVIALLLTIVLVGCSGHSWKSVSENGFWVTVSEGNDYDFYQNGKLVCESAHSCRFDRTFDKEMLLEIRKGDVVYGHLLVARKDSEFGKRMMNAVESMNSARRDAEEIAKFLPVLTGKNTKLETFVGGSLVVASLFVFPISLALNVPDQAPENRTISIGAGDSSAVAFPWNQPAKE